MTGFDDLNRIAVDLTKAGVRAQAKAPLVVKKSAADVERIAKINCELMEAVDTGFMQGSIGVDLGFGEMSAVIGPTAEYSPFVHFGTSKMSPRPFLYNAADAVEPGFVQALEQLGGDVL